MEIHIARFITPGIALSVTIASLKWFWQKRLKFKNLLFRPKLSLDISSKRIIFINKNKQEHHLPYFCLSVKNNSGKTLQKINTKQIKINESFYTDLIRNEIKNAQWWEQWSNCENDIYIMYKDNWDAISKDEYNFSMKAGVKKEFPMKLPKKAYSVLITRKHNSLLFFNKNKISVSLSINGKTYEYNINRLNTYEKYIIYLAHDNDEKPT
jgi:hypothetical protein